MNKYRLAIADDEMYGAIYRKAIYEELFENDFTVVQYAHTPDQLETLGSQKVDAYILDLNYEGSCSGYQIQDICKDIEENNTNAPIILVSGKWEDMLNVLNDLRIFNNIVSYFTWNDFNINDKKSTNNAKIIIVNKIKRELRRHFNRTSLPKDSDDKITILHLSDLQFGDKNISPSSFLTEFTLPVFLRTKSFIPDLLVITGDIAQSGKESEYDAALKWIETFSEQVWKGKEGYIDRVVAIPGNHDIDLSFYLADEYRYEWNKDKMCFDASIVPEQERQKQYSKFGFINYCNFISKITNNPLFSTKYNDLCYVNERYLEWGIRFFHTNTSKTITAKELDSVGIANTDLEKLRNSINEQDSKIFNILLGHHTLSELGYDSGTYSLQNNWAAMKNFIESSKINMYLSGHKHQVNFGKLKDKSAAMFGKKLIYSTATTLLLDAATRPPEAKRGFTVIELFKENGAVNRVKLNPFIFDGNNCKPAWDEYDLDDIDFDNIPY